MSIELTFLALTATLTALFWVPYLLNAMVVQGIGTVLSGAPKESDIQLAPWARRLQAAHGNAVENLAVYASLILVVHVAGLSTPVTTLAASTYFWARVAHYVIYGLGIPVLRTGAFVVGWCAQLAIAWQILGGSA